MAEIKRGQAKPAEEEEEEIITEDNVFEHYDEPQGFFPNQVMADLTVSFALLVITIILAYAVPADLVEPMDISTTDYVPRPEWFFFFLDQWLIYFPGAALVAFGDIAMPIIFAIVLFAIPWLDREPAYSPARRPYMVVLGFLVITAIVLNLFLSMVRILNFPGGSPAG